MKKGKLNLGVAILIAMLLGIVTGAILKEKSVMFAPLGSIFIHLIKMMVIPLVTVSIILGAASLGETKSAGKIGLGTFVYYLSTTAVAVTLGLVFGGIFKPGLGLQEGSLPAQFLDKTGELASRGEIAGFWDTILGIIPTNPLAGLVNGNILQILFFSLFLGIALSKLVKEKREPVISLLESLNEAMIWMILKVMILAPIGVFGLMADAVGTFGYDILALVLKLLIVYTVALALQTFGVYPLFVKLLSKTSPTKFIKKISKAQIVALSTASSMATLPVTFEVCEEELEVSNETTSFVLPLGATINMDGNAIYYALCAMFFAQMYGIELGMTQYIAIIITATIGSIGQAGVPGPSLLVVAVLLAAGLPVQALPLLFGVDRIFDMMRTAVNITGDASCAVIIQNMLDKEEQKS
ncbi:dicarboxylate/amino acid:cation symporter [Ilyobacter polytropus]|uniref:Sodium:dicarboxylate symporter n=1 Tax=Ilyobacter polytropus (strain ATCC 51220 / DSM 2926 / LMG 16218 / CuHBu1) TaxID=572544 RepID=E3H6C6_ILYPC|nr:dicarboxylate/amino acid:cation symporter [Ilyobacter polytropus]ADO82339.1 sodium:dicarboxylate symporter [Ilyobacter polytropus DSM 2926]